MIELTSLAELLKVIATLLAACVISIFIVAYHVLTSRSDRPWHVSRTGRNLMLKAVALGCLSVVAVLHRVDEVFVDLDIRPWIGFATAFGWSVVAGAYAWWIHEVIADHQRGGSRRLGRDDRRVR